MKAKWSHRIITKCDETAVKEGCYFDDAAAQHAVSFIETFIVLTKGKNQGKPVTLAKWQRDLIETIFGWMRKDGTRRFRQVYVEIPKKNGKSFLCSAIILYLLIADGENRAEIYSLAYDKGQAKTIFNECAIQAKEEINPDLAALLSVSPSKKEIEFATTNSFYKVLSADQGERSEGFDIHAVVIDELHTFKTAKVFNALEHGGAARSQPLNVYITTAGDNRDSLCYEKHEHAKSILDGTITDVTDFLAVIYCADPEDDWKSPKTWAKANPMLGITLTEAELQDKVKNALHQPTAEANFKRYRLNLWASDAATKWINMDLWAKGKRKYTADYLEGRECYVGIDYGAVDDLASAVFVFKEDDGSFKTLPYFWCSKANKNLNDDRFKRKYLTWKEKGFLQIHDTPEVSFDKMRADIIELSERFDIKRIAIDKAQTIHFAQQLANEGLETVFFGQWFSSMNNPCRTLERLLLSGNFHHNGHPILTWNAENVSVETSKQGYIRPVKFNGSKGREKVDGIVALVMALGVVDYTEEPIAKFFFGDTGGTEKPPNGTT